MSEWATSSDPHAAKHCKSPATVNRTQGIARHRRPRTTFRLSTVDCAQVLCCCVGNSHGWLEPGTREAGLGWVEWLCHPCLAPRLYSAHACPADEGLPSRRSPPAWSDGILLCSYRIRPPLLLACTL